MDDTGDTAQPEAQGKERAAAAGRKARGASSKKLTGFTEDELAHHLQQNPTVPLTVDLYAARQSASQTYDRMLANSILAEKVQEEEKAVDELYADNQQLYLEKLELEADFKRRYEAHPSAEHKEVANLLIETRQLEDELEALRSINERTLEIASTPANDTKSCS